MTRAEVAAATELEGRIVGLALVGGERYDDCHLVSAPRRGTKTFWVFAAGQDVFVPFDDVVQIWESTTKAMTAA